MCGKIPCHAVSKRIVFLVPYTNPSPKVVPRVNEFYPHTYDACVFGCKYVGGDEKK